MSSAINPPGSNVDWFTTDAKFHNIYPSSIQGHARRHWTPLEITSKAARFLTPGGNERVLDIGSGVGKFCLAAANLVPDAYFFGVEQRKYLVEHAECARKIMGLANVAFMHNNFTQLDFRQYDHFYFFNSFYENIVESDMIDDHIDYSMELYEYYNQRLYEKLMDMPPGTRIVTYHSLDGEMPPGYALVNADVAEMLKYWMKS